MAKEQLSSQNNGKDGLPVLMDPALRDVLSPDYTPTTSEPQTDEKISADPEKNSRNLLTKVAVGALAAVITIGGIAGLSKLTERTASTKVLISDPKNAQNEICAAQDELEKKLGLPKSPSYDTFGGCEGTTNMVTDTEEGLASSNIVEVTVSTNIFGETAEARVVGGKNS